MLERRLRPWTRFDLDELAQALMAWMPLEVFRIGRVSVDWNTRSRSGKLWSREELTAGFDEKFASFFYPACVDAQRNAKTVTECTL